MSKEELKGKWAEVFSADEQVKAAEQALSEAIRARSNALREIADRAGKGPFSVRGEIKTIKCRSKKDGSDPTYFLVGKSVSDVTFVE